LNVCVLFEKLLASWNIIAINIDSQNLCISEFFDDTFEWVTSSCSNIKNFSYWCFWVF
jgi:hypothetical protein